MAEPECVSQVDSSYTGAWMLSCSVHGELVEGSYEEPSVELLQTAWQEHLDEVAS